MLWRLVGIGVLALCAVACSPSGGHNGTGATADSHQQAGQPMSAANVARHVAAAHAAALIGDPRSAQANAAAIADDLRGSIKVPDAARLVPHEAARAAVRSLAGVRSSVWIDQSNLIVMVDGAQYRTLGMIDHVCDALAPLGDTLGVVVNLQNVAATSSHGADTLSRNCQLPVGQRALTQSKRQIDALDPALRRTFEVQQGR